MPEGLGPVLNTPIGNCIFEATPFQTAEPFSPSQVWFEGCHNSCSQEKTCECQSSPWNDPCPAPMELILPQNSSNNSAKRKKEQSLSYLQVSLPWGCYKYDKPFFVVLKCCLEFNKRSYVLLIWDINPKSRNKMTQAFQAISDACKILARH